VADTNGPRDVLHPVVIVTCTKLDAECDRQATVCWQQLMAIDMPSWNYS